MFSGKAPVDSLCGIKDNTHVFAEGDDIWDVMLNQVSLKVTLLLHMHYKIISHKLYKDLLLLLNCPLHIKVMAGERDFLGFKYFVGRDGGG